MLNPTNPFFISTIILVAFIFDFINGFHDAANAIATIVSTRVLTPRQAVVWAACFNFIGFLIFNLMIAGTIGKGLVQLDTITPLLIGSALLGAIFWNLLTWFYGFPSSSSHALIGGLAGAAVYQAGFNTLIWTGFLKVFAGIFLAPLLGIVAALAIFKIIEKLMGYGKFTLAYENKLFSIIQLGSSAFLSLTHGGNDAQKTMGIIAALLYSAHWLGETFYIPFWVVISCHLIIALGTLAGGWRIVHVMGNCITDLNPKRGAIAEMSSAAVIFLATDVGIPVSTTQTVTGSIMGVGLIKGGKGINTVIIKRIFTSWLLTIPAAAGMSASIMAIIMCFSG